MKKMMLLASMVALAALMLAAAPAFAQQGPDRVSICHFPPGNPENVQFITISERALGTHIARHGDFVADEPEDCVGAEPGPIFPPDDRDRDRDGDGFFDLDEPFITQETEQEAESGDITQNFDVSQTGDNSNQTVSTQGVANTGNAQNVIDVVDTGNFGDFDGDNDGFFNDGFVICDFDNDGNNDGNNDECEEFNDGFFGDENCFFFDGEFICGDFDNGDFDNRDFDVFDNDGTDFEFEDVGANIDISPTNTTTSSQQVNQAAAASAPTTYYYYW